MAQTFPAAVKRIGIIKPSALGDVVQSLPLLAALRGRFPEASISWVIRRDLAGLLHGHPYLADVIPFDRRGGLSDLVRLLGDLRRRRFDLVLDLQGLLRTAAMTWASRAPVRIGLQTAREGAGWACHTTVPGTGWDVPAHARCRSIAEALGITEPLTDSGLWISSAARDWAREALQNLPRPILAIHAGAGWETKRWPVEKFAAVAGRFAGSVVAVGSRSEEPLAARIVASARTGALNVAGRTSLPQLAALLESADLMLSNDSGPMHLAAAAGTSVVGVYTCTSPTISGPIPPGPGKTSHQLVATTVECAASYCKRCPQHGERHHACFAEISIERVWQAVESVSQRQATQRHSA